MIPPQSRITIPVIFESNIKGKFQRNIKYVLNYQHENSIIVFADVMPVSLELSTDYVEVAARFGTLVFIVHTRTQTHTHTHTLSLSLSPRVRIFDTT